MTPPPNDDFGRLHPLVGRQRVLLRFLWIGVALVATLALGGILLPGDAREVSAAGTIIVLIALPVCRVAWLLVRWIRRGDPRFAMVAALLLAVVGVAAAVAMTAA